MDIKKINWNLNNNFAFKPVDIISIVNKNVQTITSAFDGDSELDTPTTKFWLNYKLTPIDRVYTLNGPIPFYRTSIISSSFNKIIFPSVSPEKFLTQSIESALYFLDVYDSVKIPIEVTQTDHLYLTHTVYSDSSNLIFPTTQSSTGYSSFGLIPNERVFSIAWGDISGSGAISGSYLPDTTDTVPSKAVYYTYKTLLNQTGSLLTVGTGSLERFFAIHLDKKKLKNGIVPGTIKIPLMISSSNNSFSSSNTYNFDILNIVDYTGSVFNDIAVGSYSYLIGPSSGSGSYDIYGNVYYDLGCMVLDSDLLNVRLNLNINRNLYTDYSISPIIGYENEINSIKLFNSIQACSYKNSNITSNRLIDSSSNLSPEYFKCNVKENRIENPVFIVINPYEFNYSNNPSWKEQTIDNNSVKLSFVSNPITYITTIGLYNDNYELIAVAKLSKPLKKDQITPYMFKINLKL